MKKINLNIFIALFLLYNTYFCFAELNTYRVFFVDKGIVNDSIYNSLKMNMLPEVLARRSKVLNEDKLVSFRDVEVNNLYLEKLKPLVEEIKVVSKWMNYCVILCEDDNIDEIEDFEFVKFIQKTRELMTVNNFDLDFAIKELSAYQMMSAFESDSTYVYGKSSMQNNVLNIDKVHSLGINGDGIKIGFIDSGYKYKEHQALKNAKVIAEYDFIQNDTNTSNEKFDVWNQHVHGTSVLSTVAGFLPGTFVGISPNSEFYLTKTESLEFERHIEEDRFGAAVEWLESKGVDIINASLGYETFDTLEVSYTKDLFDGNTAISSRYANLAAELGVVFVFANVNKGPAPKTAYAPADADSVIAVGALYPDGKTVAEFSSRGPNAKDMMKPDVATIGSGVTVVAPYTDTTYIVSGGTSFASPIIAGSAALIMSVFPEIKPYQLKQILYRNSNNNESPNNDVGRGVPDIYKALTDFDILIAPIFTQLSFDFLRVYSNIIFKGNNISAKLYLKFDDLYGFKEFQMVNIQDNLFVADIGLENFKSKSAIGYIVAQSSSHKRRMPFYENKYIEIHKDSTIKRFNIDAEELPISLKSKDNIVVYPSILSNKNGHLSINCGFYNSGNTELKIFNSIGNQIYQKSFDYEPEGIKNVSIDVSSLSIGIYHIFCFRNNEILKSKFIIID